MIYHPKSPYKGQHYRLPVELIDIYPTLTSINNLPLFIGKSCPQGSKCLLRNGQSLAPVILGPNFRSNSPLLNGSTHAVAGKAPARMPMLPKRYAVTQTLLCALHSNLQLTNNLSVSSAEKDLIRSNMWDTCGPHHREDEVCLMGYSLRTKSFRYTAYLPFDRRVNEVSVPTHNITTPRSGPSEATQSTSLDRLSHPFSSEMEELYDHREDRPGSSLVFRELVNVVNLPKYRTKLQDLRRLLDNFLKPNQPQHSRSSSNNEWL
jgi:hypothetical protein